MTYLSLQKILHPERPSADIALAYMASLECGHPVVNQYKNVWVRMGLAAAKLLLDKNEIGDATRVLYWLQSNFPELLVIADTSKMTATEVKEEADSLELLDRLGIA